jgi:hypothetical protein
MLLPSSSRLFLVLPASLPTPIPPPLPPDCAAAQSPSGGRRCDRAGHCLSRGGLRRRSPPTVAYADSGAVPFSGRRSSLRHRNSPEIRPRRAPPQQQPAGTCVAPVPAPLPRWAPRPAPPPPSSRWPELLPRRASPEQMDSVGRDPSGRLRRRAGPARKTGHRAGPGPPVRHDAEPGPTLKAIGPAYCRAA